MNRTISRFGFTALAIVAGSGIYAHAQTTTTGSVSGVVTDDKGTPVAGATVTATSGQGTRTAITEANGSFRMGLLNPGQWNLKVTKGGLFAPSKQMTIYTNQNQTANFKIMAVASTVVVVEGASAAVDQTSTTTGLNLNMEDIAAIPKGRDMSSLAFFTPGVADSGITQFGSQAAQSPSINGASGAENSYVLDGLATTDFRKGFQGSSMKTDFIDQFEVQTGGFRPEFSALGGVINAVTKSGSNEYKGSAWVTWDADSLQAVPKQTIYVQQNPPNTRYDIGFETGGPLIKDKLFYFIGLDSQVDQSATPLPNADPGLVGSKSKNTDLQIVTKVNWYLTQDMQFTFFGNIQNTKFNQDTLYPNTGTGNLGFASTQKVTNLNLSYDWTISNTLFLSAKYGTTDNKTTTDPSDVTHQSISDSYYYEPGGAGNYTGTDLVGFTYRTGGTNLYQPLYEGKTTQFKVDLSWFAGSHNVKFGVSQLESKYTLVQAQGGPANAISTNGQNPVNYSIDSSGRLNTYEENTNATVKTIFTGYYLQDTWEVVSGFRLMYGARMEVQDLKDYAGNSFLKFSGSDYIQPRVGFTWDVNNDGKTKVAGSYATYYENIPQQISIRVFANEVYLRHRFNKTNPAWSYNNGNPVINNPTGYNLTIDYATPFSYDPIAEGTKLPERQEVTLGVDHTFASGWTYGVHGKYRKFTNPIEDSVITDIHGNYYDSGYAYAFSASGAPIAWAGQAILWNPGQSAAWTARTAPAGISLNSGQRFSVANTYFDKAGNTYRSFDFTGSKKTDRDYVNFSYTWSKLDGNYQGLISSSNGQADANITASMDYYYLRGSGLLPLDHTHQFKVQWSHRFTVADRDLNLGVNSSFISGSPLSKYDNSNWISPADGDFGGYGNETPVDGKLGQFGNNPDLFNTDVHLDYQMKFGQKIKVIPSFDIFNFFNSRNAVDTEQHYTDRNGSPQPRYGQALDWQIGRRFRFGIKVQF